MSARGRRMETEGTNPGRSPSDEIERLRGRALDGELSPEDIEVFVNALPSPDEHTIAGPSGRTAPTDGASAMVRTADFGRYRLYGELGHGGMGVVYCAHDTTLRREVALKVLNVAKRAGPEEIDRFHREARAAAALDHPNIVKVLDVGELPPSHGSDRGEPFFTMELIQGQDLARAVAAGLLGPRDAVEVVRQIASALAFAHQRGVLHRDVKPQNILLRDPGREKTPGTAGLHALLVDFGLAKFVERGLASRDAKKGEMSLLALTQSGELIGTPAYAAPEQVAGARDVDARADVYSLGATLYHALTGRAPFQGESLLGLLAAVVESDPVRPRRLNPSIDADLETMVLKCLAKDPVDRYASAADLAEDCRLWLDGEPLLARPLTVLALAWRRARRRKAVIVPFAALSCALAGVVVFGGISLSRSRDQQAIERSVAEAAQRLQSPDAAVRTAAHRVLDEILAAQPDHRPALLARARARSREGDWRGAEADLSRVVDLDPDGAEARLQRARVRRDAGLAAAASADLDALLARAPATFEGLLLRGEVRLELADPAGALGDLASAARAAGSPEEAFLAECVLVEQTLRTDLTLGAGAGRIASLLEKALEFDSPGPAVVRGRVRLHVALGRLFRLGGDFDAAIASFDKALALDSASSLALRERAECQFDRFPRADLWSGFAEAQSDAERAVAAAPGDVRSWWTRARVSWGGDPRAKLDPIARIGDLLDRFPHWEAAWLMKGRVLLSRGQPVEAEEAFERVLALRPGSPAALSGLGRSALDRGLAAMAEERFHDALRAEPRLHVALAGRARALAAMGRTDEARLAAAEASAEDADAGEESKDIGLAHMAYLDWIGSGNRPPDFAGDTPYVLTIETLTFRVATVDPWCRTVQLVKARSQALTRHWQAALDAYEAAAIDVSATRLEALVERARYMRDVPSVRDLAGAKRLLEQALDLSPTDAGANDEMGLLLSAQGDDEAALAAYARAMAAEPSWPAPYRHRADALLRLGRTEQAAADELAWRERTPSRVPLVARAYARIADGEARRNPEQGLLWCARALAEHPLFALGHYVRGEAQVHARRFGLAGIDMARSCRLDVALADRLYVRLQGVAVRSRLNVVDRVVLTALRQGVNADPSGEPEAHMARAFLAGLLGDAERGKAEAEAALEGDSTFTAARAWLGWMLHRLGRDDEAMKLLRQVEKEAPNLAMAPYFMACVEGARGSLDVARQHLDRSFRLGLMDDEVRNGETDLRAVLAR